MNSNERVFLSLRLSGSDESEAVDWEMWLGCLNTEEMNEKHVMLATRRAGDEDQPWIDDAGNIGNGDVLRLHWLRNPESLQDGAYLMREVVRSVANIVEGENKAFVDGNSSLKNRGLPRWIFIPRVGDKNSIDVKIDAYKRMFGDKDGQGDFLSRSTPKQT